MADQTIFLPKIIEPDTKTAWKTNLLAPREGTAMEFVIMQDGLLQMIFKNMSKEDKSRCQLTCRRWNRLLQNDMKDVHASSRKMDNLLQYDHEKRQINEVGDYLVREMEDGETLRKAIYRKSGGLIFPFGGRGSIVRSPFLDKAVSFFKLRKEGTYDSWTKESIAFACESGRFWSPPSHHVDGDDEDGIAETILEWD